MDNNYFKYKVYGLNIRSEIELDELIKIEDNSNYEINISYGNITETAKKQVQEQLGETVCMYIDRSNMCLHVKDIAFYQICNGNEIIVEPIGDKTNERIKSFLLGWSFGILFVQRNTLALHGSAMVKGDKAFIIAGQSKAGKSTLAAALKLNGYHFLSDDVCTINIDFDNKLIINPAYPQQKLCTDTMEKLGYNADEYKLNIKGSHRERFKVNMDDCFVKKSVPINSVFQISLGDTDRVKIEKLEGSDKMECLLDNVYFLNVERELGMRPEYFRQCLKVVKDIQFFKIVRPKDKFTVEDQVKIIEEVLVEI